MNRKEAIEFGESRLGLFGGQMDMFIRFAINDMKTLEERVNTVETSKLLQEAIHDQNT